MTIDVMRPDQWMSHGYPARSRNSRVLIFSGAFILACIVSLAYTFIRPPVYISTASILVSPPKNITIALPASSPGHPAASVNVSTGDDEAPGDARASGYLLMEIQKMTSPSLMEAVVTRLKGTGSGDVSVSDLQSMLRAVQVPGTNIVKLSAAGHRAASLPVILNAWVGAYLDAWAKSTSAASSTALDQQRQQVQTLQQQVAAKQKAVDDFRRNYDIVSVDGNQNEALARIKSLTTALNNATTTQVTAQSTLQSLQDSIAHGHPAILPEDKAALSSLDSEAVKLTEKIADKENGFTPLYASMDPQLTALKSSLVRLRAEIKQQRRASQDAALSQAQQAVTSARQSADRLRGQLRAAKQAALDFTTRFAQHKALLASLDQLEGLYNASQDRLAEMEATDADGAAQASVLDKPTMPLDPAYPKYARDAAISVAGSLLFGILAVWFVEFFKRSDRHTASDSLPPRIQIAAFPGYAAPVGSNVGVPTAPPLLAATADTLPRELSEGEVTALLAATAGDGRLVLTAVLSGLTLEELAALTWDDIDVADGVIHLPEGRVHTVRPPLLSLFALRDRGSSAAPLFSGPDGVPLTVSDLEGLIACASHDAGIGAASDVTARVLRHTYLAFLVRQGVRMGELGRLVGHVPPALFTAYGRLAPPGARVALEHIDVTLPALRGQSDSV